MGTWSAPNLQVYALMKWKEKRPRTLGVNRTGMRLRLRPPPRGVILVCGPRMGPHGHGDIKGPIATEMKEVIRDTIRFRRPGSCISVNVRLCSVNCTLCAVHHGRPAGCWVRDRVSPSSLKASVIF